MQKTLLVALLVAVVLVVGVTSQDSMLAPPDRPTEFRSPNELRRYLKALNEYYAIVGRPRFGRSISKRMAEMAAAAQGDADITE
ncbi:pro-neuropeptide Y-like isoform X2 [Liolophura sinensis]|uniref:pro-neuropeptide Y-like isoform X2 n=1 Tax=Liolophura sinensis TaxID=3198878 RepID=UPI0031598BDC